jgi:hypothetical protein
MFLMSSMSRTLCLGHLLAIVLAIFVASAAAQMAPPGSRGPLARLVRNPDQSGSLPPYALTDQTGAIQRYVEPVPGIDLDAYVNQIVTVRHDTGQTLLASQLDFPSPGLMPLVSDYGQGGLSQPPYDRSVRQVQHVDRDDTTVELIEEGESVPNGAMHVPQGAMPQTVYPDGSYPMFPGEMSPGMPMYADPSYGNAVYCDPMYCGQQGMAPYVGPYPGAYGAEYPNADFIQPHAQAAQAVQERAHIYADVEINFLRAHLMEEGFGKLSEKYEFSPRIILGFTDIGGLNGRVRYWTYGRQTDVLDDGNVRLEFDVFDFEATHHFTGRRSIVVLAGGVRFAQINLDDQDEDEAGTDLLGLTVAADGFTPFLTFNGGSVGWAYGGRLSLLGGDWGGDDDNDFINERHRDDNVVAHELYAGIECSHCYRSCNIHARLAFEMQNWHSDVISDSTDIDTIALVGPGLQIGAEF